MEDNNNRLESAYNSSSNSRRKFLEAVVTGTGAIGLSTVASASSDSADTIQYSELSKPARRIFKKGLKRGKEESHWSDFPTGLLSYTAVQFEGTTYDLNLEYRHHPTYEISPKSIDEGPNELDMPIADHRDLPDKAKKAVNAALENGAVRQRNPIFGHSGEHPSREEAIRYINRGGEVYDLFPSVEVDTSFVIYPRKQDD